MGKSKRKVECETRATVFERSQHRPVIVTVEPDTGIVGFRLKGTQRTYELRADALYCAAVARGAVATSAKAKR